MKKYKVMNGKQLLKKIIKGKIDNQFIVIDYRGFDCVGFFIGIEHYSTGKSMLLKDLFKNNTFYVYKNNHDNYELIEPSVRKYNKYFR